MDIPVTFALITAGTDMDRLAQCTESIARLGIPEHEVLIIGGERCTLAGPALRHLPVREPQGYPGWITRKKNLGTLAARHEVVVYFHDYQVFDPDWYRQLCAFGTDWDICMHRVLCVDGTRFFGWQIWDHPTIPRYVHVPYDRHDLLPHMYLSGGYWVAKRSAMRREPLDERLRWGEAEDVEWSLRVREHLRIRMNPDCTVRHLKPHAALPFCQRMAAQEALFAPLFATAQAPARPAGRPGRVQHEPLEQTDDTLLAA